MPKIRLFVLSTCVWCKRTQEFLERSRIQFELICVNELRGKEREKALAIVRRYNPRISFPTLVVNHAAVIGFDEEKIRKVLKIRWKKQPS